MSAPLLLLLAVLLLAIPWMMGPRGEGEHPDFDGRLLVLWWLNRLYCGVWHRLDLTETRALPESGPALLVANHTCGIDHMLIQALTRRALGFMIAQEIYEGRFLRPFYDLVRCIPVKRDGRDLAAMRAAIRALGEGRIVPIFPEGRIYPNSGRELGPGKPGAGYIALRTGVPVIPAYLWGTPETREIGESLLTPSASGVLFGPPVDLSDLRLGGEDERAMLAEATRRIMAAIEALKCRVQDGTRGTAPAASTDVPRVEPVPV